ncbi:hypothetical protein [uncultured Lamprocystis sp.]|jgi:hypothetical protein|uniref:hypothetical protein n=1 Tax=uncultured Lamprocystis sp. TaxID=543132 RepID=UPI0025F31AA9|nr:hypothetical protein [uncultured Lamprocystis sp.]
MSAEHGRRIPRFQVQITNAYPELADDLTRVSPRARPERLRALALVGLAVLGGTLPTRSAPAAAPSEPAADPQLDRRLRLLDAISDHV